uniref:Uncharacterized protein n=1 Tax=Cacopsylla melanoneura TaxID=428564 RepID=A0A8D8YY96_9HEMI
MGLKMSSTYIEMTARAIVPNYTGSIFKWSFLFPPFFRLFFQTCLIKGPLPYLSGIISSEIEKGRKICEKIRFKTQSSLVFLYNLMTEASIIVIFERLYTLVP